MTVETLNLILSFPLMIKLWQRRCWLILPLDLVVLRLVVILRKHLISNVYSVILFAFLTREEKSTVLQIPLKLFECFESRYCFDSKLHLGLAAES